MNIFNKKQDDLAYLLCNLNHTASDNFALDLVCVCYPFSLEEIDKFQSILNWKFISRNPYINWTSEYISKYCDKIDLRTFPTDILGTGTLNINAIFDICKNINTPMPWWSISCYKKITWHNHLICDWENNWDWETLSKNSNFPWNIDLITKYIDKVNWDKLSKNSGLNWTIDLIDHFFDKWNWNNLSGNEGIYWSDSLLEKYQKKIDWNSLSVNSNLDWNKEFIAKNKHKLNWELFSQNIGVKWSINLFETYKIDLDKYYLSLNPAFPWTEEFIEKNIDWINFEGLSGNKAFFWTENFIEKYFDKLRWEFYDESYWETGNDGLSKVDLPWTIDFVKKYEDKIVWINYAHHHHKDCFFYKKLIRPYLDTNLVNKILQPLIKSMKTQFVCLANSYKEGNRCVAGIVLENGQPVIENGQPKWVRPVCETPHGEVPTHLVSHINLLDIVEIDITKEIPEDFQSENVLFGVNSIKVIGKFPLNNLINLCDNSQTSLFGNKGGAVIPANAKLLSNSLRMIKVESFTVVEKLYENNPNPKLRLSFTFNDNSYEIPITDPAFLNAYKTNKNLLTASSDVFVVMSLGVLHDGWHSKLVAGVFYN